MFRKQVVLTKKSPTKTNQKDSCRNVVSPSGEEIPERTAVLNEALAIAAEMVLEEVERATKKLREEKESYAKRAEYFDAKVADLEAVIKAKDLDITQLQKREVETFSRKTWHVHSLCSSLDKALVQLYRKTEMERDVDHLSSQQRREITKRILKRSHLKQFFRSKTSIDAFKIAGKRVNKLLIFTSASTGKSKQWKSVVDSLLCPPIGETEPLLELVRPSASERDSLHGPLWSEQTGVPLHNPQNFVTLVRNHVPGLPERVRENICSALGKGEKFDDVVRRIQTEHTRTCTNRSPPSKTTTTSHAVDRVPWFEGVTRIDPKHDKVTYDLRVVAPSEHDADAYEFSFVESSRLVLPNPPGSGKRRRPRLAIDETYEVGRKVEWRVRDPNDKRNGGWWLVRTDKAGSDEQKRAWKWLKVHITSGTSKTKTIDATVQRVRDFRKVLRINRKFRIRRADGRAHAHIINHRVLRPLEATTSGEPCQYRYGEKLRVVGHTGGRGRDCDLMRSSRGYYFVCEPAGSREMRDARRWLFARKILLGSGGEARVMDPRVCAYGVFLGYDCVDEKMIAIKQFPRDSEQENEDTIANGRENDVLHAIERLFPKPQLLCSLARFETVTSRIIVMDLCRAELRDMIFEGVQFTMHEIRRILFHLIDAVATLHSYGICHADIKLRNIMFARLRCPASVRLLDYGQSVFLGKDCEAVRYNAFGTASYHAPETRSLVAQTRHDPSEDMYAIGLIAFVMFACATRRNGGDISQSFALRLACCLERRLSTSSTSHSPTCNIVANIVAFANLFPGRTLRKRQGSTRLVRVFGCTQDDVEKQSPATRKARFESLWAFPENSEEGSFEPRYGLLPQEARPFVKLLLAPNPSQRLTATQALTSRWLRSGLMAPLLPSLMLQRSGLSLKDQMRKMLALFRKRGENCEFRRCTKAQMDQMEDVLKHFSRKEIELCYDAFRRRHFLNANMKASYASQYCAISKTMTGLLPEDDRDYENLGLRVADEKRQYVRKLYTKTRNVKVVAIPVLREILSELGINTERLSPRDLRKMFKSIDRDNDGQISFKELMVALKDIRLSTDATDDTSIENSPVQGGLLWRSLRESLGFRWDKKRESSVFSSKKTQEEEEEEGEDDDMDKKAWQPVRGGNWEIWGGTNHLSRCTGGNEQLAVHSLSFRGRNGFGVWNHTPHRPYFEGATNFDGVEQLCVMQTIESVKSIDVVPDVLVMLSLSYRAHRYVMNNEWIRKTFVLSHITGSCGTILFREDSASHLTRSKDLVRRACPLVLVRKYLGPSLPGVPLLRFENVLLRREKLPDQSSGIGMNTFVEEYMIMAHVATRGASQKVVTIAAAQPPSCPGLDYDARTLRVREQACRISEVLSKHRASDIHHRLVFCSERPLVKIEDEYHFDRWVEEASLRDDCPAGSKKDATVIAQRIPTRNTENALRVKKKIGDEIVFINSDYLLLRIISYLVVKHQDKNGHLVTRGIYGNVAGAPRSVCTRFYNITSSYGPTSPHRVCSDGFGPTKKNVFSRVVHTKIPDFLVRQNPHFWQFRQGMCHAINARYLVKPPPPPSQLPSSVGGIIDRMKVTVKSGSCARFAGVNVQTYERMNPHGISRDVRVDPSSLSERGRHVFRTAMTAQEFPATLMPCPVKLSKSISCTRDPFVSSTSRRSMHDKKANKRRRLSSSDEGMVSAQKGIGVMEVVGVALHKARST
eukprot:g2320.t1